MGRSLLDDMTTPYSSAESFVYDRWIAPGTTALAVDMFDELAEVPDGAKILDVGCGGGQIAIEIARRLPDVEICGLDLSPEQVGRARQRAAGLGERVSFVVGSALGLEFDDESFDAVMSSASIKHWPDMAAGLAECVRVLKPGGLLFVAEVDRGCRFDDAMKFLARTRVPNPMLPLAMMGFRTYVAGRSIDAEDAQELTHGLEMSEVEVIRPDGLPIVLIRGNR